MFGHSTRHAYRMDEEPKAKRSRSANYTSGEKNLLLNIIHKFKSILECKKTDALTWREKEDTWKTVADIFNSSSRAGIYRQTSSLKKVYANIKKSARKEAANENTSIVCTGEGKPEICKNSESLETDWGNYKTDYLKKPINPKLLPKAKKNKRQLPPETKTTDVDSIPNTIPSTLHWAGNVTNSTPSTSHWDGRNKPVITSLASSELSKRYNKLAELKIEIAETELEKLIDGTGKEYYSYMELEIDSQIQENYISYS